MTTDNQADFSECSFTGSADVVTPGPSGDQTFVGTATASATPGTWKVAIDTITTNYMRDMYQWTLNADGSECCAPTTAAATAVLTDSLTVNDSGGPGVYSLSYIFSLDGTLSSSDESLFDASFCTSVYMPQGTGTAPSECLNPGQTIPSTFTLTYADLPFGGPITPTIAISAYGFIEPLDPSQVGGPDDTIINGTMNVDFGDTVNLEDVLVTDANGNPIPGVTISSGDGYYYPLDPANATPEPGALAPLGLAGLALFGWLRRRRL